mmetsp:Transcript_50290/g.155826  ORF Transcript_50290/g.155826 Transcript_50290/m.155826 type:complete len:257 (+) Transcript_50290:227-997(+)
MLTQRATATWHEWRTNSLPLPLRGQRPRPKTAKLRGTSSQPSRAVWGASWQVSSYRAQGCRNSRRPLQPSGAGYLGRAAADPGQPGTSSGMAGPAASSAPRSVGRRGPAAGVRPWVPAALPRTASRRPGVRGSGGVSGLGCPGSEGRRSASRCWSVPLAGGVAGSAAHWTWSPCSETSPASGSEGSGVGSGSWCSGARLGSSPKGTGQSGVPAASGVAVTANPCLSAPWVGGSAGPLRGCSSRPHSSMPTVRSTWG